MSKAEALRHFYETNIACGDIGEAAEARMLAEIAEAEAQDQTRVKSRPPAFSSSCEHRQSG